VIRQTIKTVNNRQKDSKYEYAGLDNEKKSFEFNATEADRGGYGVHFLFVKNNRFYEYNDIITIPWTNKDLNIEYATFRDKTLPGSEEKWKVKISGFKKEKIAAEILASMYDASLDQFKFHSWSEPNIWPQYSYNSLWKSDHNFSEFESEGKPDNTLGGVKSIEKSYDELISDIDEAAIHFHYANIKGHIIRREMTDISANAAPAPMKEAKIADGLAGRVAGVQIIKDEDQNKKTKFEYTIWPMQDKAVQIRKNFNETAFFFPDLRTNENGDIEFSFTMPEALTRWKFQALTHTKELAFGYSSKEIVTQNN
jgi:hypothetical protein